MIRKVLIFTFLHISLILNAQVLEFYNNSFEHSVPVSINQIGEYLYYSFSTSDSIDIYTIVNQTGVLSNQNSFCKIYKTTISGGIIDSLIIPIDSGFYAYEVMKGINNKLYLIGFNYYDFNNPPLLKILQVSNELILQDIAEFNIQMDIVYWSNYVFNENEMVISIHGSLDGNEIENIYKIDEYLDTIFTTVPSFISVFRLFDIPNKEGYILQQGPLDICRLDKNFNIIWENGAYFTFNPAGEIFWNEDNSVAITIAKYNDPWTYGVEIGLVKSDSLFSYPYEQVVTFGNSDDLKQIGKNAVIYNQQRGFYIGHFKFFASYVSYFANEPGYFTISNYSSNLDFVWEKTFGQNGDSVYYVNDLVDVGDGIILSGWKYRYLDENPNIDVFLYKFDYQGNFNTIFERPGGPMNPEVFPNPGVAKLCLRTYGNSIGKIFHLYDSSGKLLIMDEIDSNYQEWDTGSLPSGQYIWQVQNKQKIIGSGKWIKL